MGRTILYVAIVVMFAVLSFAPTPTTAQGSADFIGVVCAPHPWEPECAGPLPDATLTISKAGALPAGLADVEETTTTDEEGWFGFPGLEEGTYTLQIERTGFEPFETTVQVPYDDEFVATLQGTQVEASGTVLSPNGEGVPDARVTFEYGDDRAEASTDDAGAFTASTTAGYQAVRVEHPSYYGHYSWDLIDGGAMQITLEDAPDRTGIVTGTITDQNGDPVAGVSLTGWQYDHCCYAEPVDAPYAVKPYDPHNTRQETRTDAGGRYEMAFFPGWVELSGWKDGHASLHRGLEVQEGSQTHDFEMRQFPPKTAHIEGRVTGDGAGLRYVSISVESPEYGLHECSAFTGEASAVEDHPDRAYWEEEYRGCAITVHEDGRFEGSVTPGYSLFRVHYQHWRSCTETHDSDGSYHRDCGPEFFGHVQTLNLPADETTRIDVDLVPRPGPDAVLSGYVVNGETQQAIQGVQVSFYNQQSYGSAWATTDADGSYRVRVHSGYHEVSVWAEGFLPWSGTIQVAPDKERAFDIVLTPGESAYGGCCYAHAEPGYAMEASTVDASDGGFDTAEESPRVATDSDDRAADASAGFEDLGGGLGPYDPDKRSTVLAERESPGLGLLAVVLGIAVVAARRR